MKTTALVFLFAGSLLAEDVMVERMQSVVDEVTELRSRYESSARNNEACQQQLREQTKIIEKASQSEGLDYKVFEANRKRLELLEEENSALNKRLVDAQGKKKAKEISGLEKELELLLKENTRLNTSAKILMEKNHSLLDQLNSLKGSRSSGDELSGLKKEVLSLQESLKRSQEANRALEQEIVHISTDAGGNKPSQKEPVATENCSLLSDVNRRLEEELRVLKTETVLLEKKCKPKTIAKIKKVTNKVEPKSICLDENPFPKLMMKEKKTGTAPKKRLIDKEEVPNSLEESISEDEKEVVLEKGRTYRLKHESAIYEAPDGKVIAVWEEKTSFTSNIYKGEWIKITGHFINMKWTKSAEEMWIKEKETVKR